MQVHSAFPAGVLLTNGLGADGASGALITARKWSIFGCDATITLQPTSSGGGSRPFAPGEIQTFYKPVTTLSDNKFDSYIPTNIEAKQKNVIIVKVNIGDIKNEKEFVLGKKPFKLLVKMLNIINITDNKVKVSMNSVKLKLNNIKLLVKNIVVKK